MRKDGKNVKKIIVNNGNTFKSSMELWLPHCPQCEATNTYGITKFFFFKRYYCNNCQCEWKLKKIEVK